MRVIDASETGILVLGYQGESQRVMVRLPLVDERNGRNVAEEFPGGQFSLSVTFPNRPGEFIVSPSDYQVDGDWLEWVVKAAYTQFFGEGKLQINYSGFDSTGMTKSRVWRITNKKSISTGAGTVPDWSDWKTELLNAAAAVQNAVDSYDEMTAEAEDGDQTSAHIDRTGDHPVLHIEIKNNGGGGGGADIDDDHTRTDKTWSSKKISDELDTKADEEDLSSLSETIVELTGAVDGLSDAVSGKYTKPSGGIPETDMTDDVRTLLGKADTALQTHQDISGKINEPASEGTAGQILATNGNGGRSWVTPETGVALIDPTLSIPDAAADAAAAGEKLNGKAPAIAITSENAYNHNSNGGKISEINIIGNGNTIGNVKYANKPNLLPPVTQHFSDEDLTYDLTDYVCVFTGSKNTNITPLTYNDPITIPAGTYKLIVKYDGGNSTGTAWSKTQVMLNAQYTQGGSGEVILNKYISSFNVAEYVYDFELEEDTYSLYLAFQINANNNYDGAKFWYGLYESDAVLTDTGETVQSGETLKIVIPDSFSGTEINTVQNKGNIKYVADTKTYIDSKEIVVDDELTYLRPENEAFGAVGDGTADDTTALNNCIAYAISHGMAVRAFRSYKTTSPVEIVGDHADIYIKKINYTGVGSAVKINGSHNTIRINEITSGGIGIELFTNNDNSSMNIIEVEQVYSQSTGVYLNATNGFINCNRFVIKRVYSTNGNCLEGAGYTDYPEFNKDARMAENYFYDTVMFCNNGWAIYKLPGRYYNINMESNVKNGIYIDGANSAFFGCRYAEMINKKINALAEGTTADEGTLIKYIRGSFVFVAERQIPYQCIDVSEAWDASNASADELNALMWGGAIIQAPISMGMHYAIQNSSVLVGDTMFLWGNRKICVPKFDSIYTISTADFDMRDAQVMLNNVQPYATKFIVGVADCVIHLPTSYCSQGYSEFIVDQSTPGKTCTIYDARDSVTPIFNGATAGNGVYKFKAYCDIAAAVGGTKVGNDGNNDTWIVEKLS